jgi:ABC-type transport system involved in cytochrome bd biosynthesis fused ATPase/permease subunit
VGPGGLPLSGGERRLIALARALATDLPVLLLDEPTEGLDDKARARVLESIRALSTHRTLVVVTHRPEVAALAARVVTLDPISKLAAE